MESILLYGFLFIFGSAIGSFLNVLIDRLPHNQSITGRSHCDHCKRSLHWYELIPVFSYFFIKGKSTCCKKKLSFFYPVIEILTGVCFVFSWIYVEPQMFTRSLPPLFEVFFPFDMSYVVDTTKINILFQLCVFGLISCFIVIFFADSKYYIIPDAVQIGALVFTFLIYLILQISLELFIYKLISSIIIAFPIFLLFMGTKMKGIGFADVKYAGVMGFVLGAFSGFWALYIAFLSGAIISIIAILLKKKKLKSHIPFGPFLVIGTIVLLFVPHLVYDTIYMIFGFHFYY